jgi:septal ring factor EnvC (AmiA/AmiB activator)
MKNELQGELDELLAALEDIDAMIDAFERSIASLKATRARGIRARDTMLAEAFAELDDAGTHPPPARAN